MDKEIEKRIDAANDQMLSDDAPEAPEEASGAQPIDYYQAQRNAAYNASQRATTNGSPAEVKMIVNSMVEDFKESRYNMSKNLYDHLLDANAPDQAEYMRQDYMTKNALPLVEGLVEMYGVDAILNNKGALEKLDEVMITPNGSGSGFTRGYLEQMHEQQRGAQPSYSDAEVTMGIRKIKNMANGDDIRGSVAKAQKLKEKIDRGELSANDDDYKLLLQVSSYK